MPGDVARGFEGVQVAGGHVGLGFGGGPAVGRPHGGGEGLAGEGEGGDADDGGDVGGGYGVEG